MGDDKKPEAPSGYRFLEGSEIVQVGDLKWNPDKKAWLLISGASGDIPILTHGERFFCRKVS